MNQDEYFVDDLDGGRIMKKDCVSITGLKLGRNRTHAIVYIEVGGQWVEIVREELLSQFDHVVNVSGMKRLIREHCEKLMNDLIDSGGIVDAP